MVKEFLNLNQSHETAQQMHTITRLMQSIFLFAENEFVKRAWSTETTWYESSFRKNNNKKIHPRRLFGIHKNLLREYKVMIWILLYRILSYPYRIHLMNVRWTRFRFRFRYSIAINLIRKRYWYRIWIDFIWWSKCSACHICLNWAEVSRVMRK